MTGVQPCALPIWVGPLDEGLLFSDTLHELWLGSHPTVVLAGSHSASGRLSQDGVLGLPRAVLAAGARSVVACLWDAVDDATEALLTAFHAALAADPTTSQAQALRAACLAVRAADDGKWAHPLFWAGFTLTGAGAVAFTPP